MSIDGAPLVETSWLAARLGAPDVRIVDASWRLPGASGSARADFERRRIPGAVFFDLDRISDQETDLPHMLPSTAHFSASVGELGINARDAVVVYDEAGIFSSARVWWTFRVFGHERVAVLNGGLKKWIAEGRPLETTASASPTRAIYVAGPARDLVRNADDVRMALADDRAVVLDARPAARFDGAKPEPRAGLRSGHMPGAQSLPYASLLDDDGRMKSVDQLTELFCSLDVAAGDPVIATCGSGVTAAVIALAIERIGAGAPAIYDGSWAEWGRETNDPHRFPVATRTIA